MTYSDYHHGEQSLYETIINMSQTFQNTNNINFMTPVGQFGNVLGDQAASARYISIENNPIITKIYPRKLLQVMPRDI